MCIDRNILRKSSPKACHLMNRVLSRIDAHLMHERLPYLERKTMRFETWEITPRQGNSPEHQLGQNVREGSSNSEALDGTHYSVFVKGVAVLG